eukprot:CAMPEP_0183783288 /NCGR_PEP_ID=MMETSP0739-20130205/63178_1 /TAXON_ID=385413 /ORGANISM="Thalassiosira miniscula, Strain CCMP1093" /LENGTH=41 /DNA_ID= /DNA_START= /DNA_END= /DNA_ORIENTATION=
MTQHTERRTENIVAGRPKPRAEDDLLAHEDVRQERIVRNVP